jgi:hypothetical protein
MVRLKARLESDLKRYAAMESLQCSIVGEFEELLARRLVSLTC